MKKQFPNSMAVEVRDQDGQPVITGYAAVYHQADDPGTEFELLDNYVERIMPGAFDNALETGQDVRGLFNHDPNQVLGRTGAGTMTLSADSIGLRYDIIVPDTQLGRDVATSISRGDVTGSSFSFKVADGGAEIRKDGDKTIRELRSVNLFDAGPVTFPAYSGSSAGLRAGLRTAENIKEAESALWAWLDETRKGQEAVDVRARLVALGLN